MPKKNPHAQALGSLGGKASQGGRKGMTEERKSEIGRKAAQARWEKHRREQERKGAKLAKMAEGRRRKRS